MVTTLSVVLVHGEESVRAELRAALVALPGVEVVGERHDLRSGLALAHQSRPTILVLELANPADDALSAASQFRLEHPECAVFFMTDRFDPDTLLRAMRAGAQEVLRRPLDRSALSQAVERVGAMNARRGGGSTGRSVIAVFSNKGGSGVSTIAANLALSLRRSTRREVALADFDYQSGDAAFMLGLSPTRSLADVLSAPRIDSASVHDALMKHDSGIYVLSQPEHLDRVDGVTPDQVGNVLELLASTFEIVVVDAPHVFNDISVELFDRSNAILLVAELSIPSVRSARRSLELFHKLNFLAGAERVRLTVNRYSTQSDISLPQLEETLGLSVFGTVTNDFAAVSRAINLGKPLCGESSPSKAARDIATLARKLVPVESADEPAQEIPVRKPARLRLFGRG